MNQVFIRHPITQVRRRQQGRVPIDVYKSGSHTRQLTTDRRKKNAPKVRETAKDTILVGRGRLRKLAASGIWHSHHNQEYGEWTSKSTGHRDKGGAVQWAEAYSLSLTQEEVGLGNSKKLTGDDDINKAIEEWLAYQYTQNKRKTHRSYTRIMRKLRKFLTTKPGSRRLRNITIETILEYR